MKHSISITNVLKLGALALASGWVQTLGAFTYSDTDLLLVFRRDQFNDVEFNIGSVSNFLGKANGTVMTVTNWSITQVSNNFNHSLTGVKFLLLATTSGQDSLRRAWLTDAAAATPTDVSGSKMSGMYSKINFAGLQPSVITASNSSEVYIIAPSDPSSYSYIASSGGSLDASTISGSAPFSVENLIPATNRFVELKISNVTPKPAATIVGTFSLTSAGVLTFTAGPPVGPLTSSHIQHIARAGNVNTITFTTVNGASYRLRYNTTLVPGISGWTTLPTTVPGDGSDQSLTDTTSDAQRFYNVEAFR